MDITQRELEHSKANARVRRYEQQLRYQATATWADEWQSLKENLPSMALSVGLFALFAGSLAIVGVALDYLTK